MDNFGERMLARAADLMRLRPLRGEIIVELEPRAGQTRHGVVLVHHRDPDHEDRGRLVAMADSAAQRLAREGVSAGDTVIFKRGRGREIHGHGIDGVGRLMRLRVSDVDGVLA